MSDIEQLAEPDQQLLEGAEALVAETPQQPTLDDFLVLQSRIDGLTSRLEAAEAWICRRPDDAIPQVYIDQITAQAIASVTPVEEVPDGNDEDPGLETGQ